MHGHDSARSERVRFGVLWSKSKSGFSDPNVLGPEYRDDVQGSDQVEPLSSRIVVDRDRSRAPMFAHAEEDVDNCSNWAGCCRLR